MQKHPHPSDNTADARYREARNVTLVGAVLDLVLGVVKIVVGTAAQSQALIADGIHSLSDLATDVLVIFAAKHGSRDADEDHPYGHGRIETVATVVLGFALIAVAIGITWGGIARLLDHGQWSHPGMLALVVAAISVASKEWIYRYTLRAAERLRSSMLRANAWHSRSDAVSSIVVMIGVGGALLGFPYLDSVAAVVVAWMIGKIGWDLSWQGLQELIDAGLGKEHLAHIRRTIREVPGVRAMHLLRTRQSGGVALADVHIQVEPNLSVSEGHQIGETVRAHLIDAVDELTDVTVHVDPENDEQAPVCDKLPDRNEILRQLDSCWQELLPPGAADTVTLHYLSGKVHVDVVLSLELAGVDIASARKLSKSLVEATRTLEDIGEVRVYFH